MIQPKWEGNCKPSFQATLGRMAKTVAPIMKGCACNYYTFGCPLWIHNARVSRLRHGHQILKEFLEVWLAKPKFEVEPSQELVKRRPLFHLLGVASRFCREGHCRSLPSRYSIELTRHDSWYYLSTKTKKPFVYFEYTKRWCLRGQVGMLLHHP